MRWNSAIASTMMMASCAKAFILPKKFVPKALVGGAVTIAAGVTLKTLKKRQDMSNTIYDIYKPDAGSLVGHTIVITGGSSGLGLESAKRLAMAGANIIVTTRSDTKGKLAVDQVLSYIKNNDPSVEYRNQKISYKLLNLDDLQNMKERILGSSNDWNEVQCIDVLLNNAGVMALPDRQLTVDGIERQMQSNHLGHFALTAMLANSNRFSENAKIINVSSSAHTFAKSGIIWDYLWEAHSGYGPWRSYGQSKLANIHFTTELQRRIDKAGIKWHASTLHPGVVNTDLGRNLIGEERYNRTLNDQGNWLESLVGKGLALFLKTVESGASTQVWLASGAENEDVCGKYFDNCKSQILSASAMDKDDAERLWIESEKLTGINFNLEQI